MNDNVNNSGPAFPVKNNQYPELNGMSLRDWFAGQALGSIPLRTWGSDYPKADDMIDAWARCAYQVADAMIAARNA